MVTAHLGDKPTLNEFADKSAYVLVSL